MIFALKVIAFVVVTFILAPLALYYTFLKIIGPSKGARTSIAGLAFALAPLCIALLMYWIYSTVSIYIGRFAPAIVVLIIAIPLYLRRARVLSDLAKFFCGTFESNKRPFLLLLLVPIVIVIVVQLATMPLFENDALEYAAVSKHIFEAGTLSVYPVTVPAENGLYAPPSHPPAFHMYIIWGFSWLGTGTFLPMRLLAFQSVLATLVLFAQALKGRKDQSHMLSAILLLSTPLYVTLAVGYHIDALRLLSFLAAALSVARLIEDPRPQEAAVTGIVLGLAAFSHSIGILSWVFGGAAWLLLGPSDRFRNFRVPLVVGTIAVLVGGAHYFKNLYLYGVPLHDAVPIWDMPELDFYTDLRYRRDLLTAEDRFVFGVFRSFSEVMLFSFVYWLLLPAIFMIWRRRLVAGKTELVLLVWIASYFSVAVLTALGGSDLVIKNPRYAMTILPLVILIVAPALAKALEGSYWMRLLTLLLLILTPGWMLVQSAWRLSNFGGRLDIYTLGERAPIYRANNRFPGAPLYRYIEANRKPGEKTLVFRQADFSLYGSGSWIDNFDETLEPFYRLQSAAEAHLWLQRHNVRFVLVPNYFWPTYTRTIVNDLLADSALVEDVGSHRGYRLFALRDNASPFACHTVPSEQVAFTIWQSESSWLRFMRSLTGIPFLNFDTINAAGVVALKDFTLGSSVQGSPIQLTTGHGAEQLLATGAGPLNLPPQDSHWSRLANMPDPIHLSMVAEGEGYVAVEIVQYVQLPSRVDAQVARLWEGVVDRMPRRISASFRPSPNSVSFRIIVRKVGRAPSVISLTDFTICRGVIPKDVIVADEQPSLVVADWSTLGLAVGCRQRDTNDCTSRSDATFVSGVAGGVRRFWGSIDRLSTPGFQPGLRFSLRTRLEAIRESLEAYPESTLASILLPLSDYTQSPAPDGYLSYQLLVNASGRGSFSAYIQYTMPDGSVDWAHAGDFYLDVEPRMASLQLKLPVGARDFAVVLSGGATFVAISKFLLERNDKIVK